jgi:DNA-binding NtrC family response regulator
MNASYRTPSNTAFSLHYRALPAVEVPERTGALAGHSGAIARIRHQIQRLAPYFRTVMITGEPHCGADSAAELLYRLSPFSDRPMLSLDAAEAERALAGGFPAAAVVEAGMLLLPCPERLSRSAQMNLLQLIRNRSPLPPRVVVFAEHGLRPLVSAANFSAELESTLSALRIVMPSLRDRAEDIPDLLFSALAEAATGAGCPVPELAPDLLEAAAMYGWPGNFPELIAVANALLSEALSASPGGLALGITALDAALAASSTVACTDYRAPRLVRLEQILQEHVRAVLLACNGNKLRAADILGISRSTLYRMLEAPLT